MAKRQLPLHILTNNIYTRRAPSVHNLSTFVARLVSVGSPQSRSAFPGYLVLSGINVAKVGARVGNALELPRPAMTRGRMTLRLIERRNFIE